MPIIRGIVDDSALSRFVCLAMRGPTYLPAVGSGRTLSLGITVTKPNETGFMTRLLSFRTLLTSMACVFPAASVLGSEVVTGFEFTDLSGNFTLGTSPNTVTFSGGQAKSVGNPNLYHDGVSSWMIDGGRQGDIRFATPATEVDFWFRNSNASGAVTITFFNPNQSEISTFIQFATDWFHFNTADIIGPLAPQGFGRIQITAPPGSYTVVDEFRFCVGAAAACTTNAECDDNDVCNGAETCVSGVCVSGTSLTCNDQDPCTDDSCDSLGGCTTAPNTGADCDDNENCTQNDTCSSGTCAGTEIPGCGDDPNQDMDGDGVPDLSDGCPLDSNKTDAGVCGCGVLDVDLDDDGTIDCLSVPSGEAPSVTVIVSAIQGLSPLTVQFNGNALSNVEIDLAKTTWSFGDGVSFTGSAATSHTYEVADDEVITFTARLSMTDIEGNVGSAEVLIQVVGVSATSGGVAATEADVSIVAGLSSAPGSDIGGGPSPLDMLFSVTTSTFNGTIQSVHWNLGDGTELDGLSAPHTYVDEDEVARTFIVVATVQLVTPSGTMLTRIVDRVIVVEPGTAGLGSDDFQLPGTTPLGNGGSPNPCGLFGVVPMLFSWLCLAAVRFGRPRSGAKRLRRREHIGSK